MIPYFAFVLPFYFPFSHFLSHFLISFPLSSFSFYIFPLFLFAFSYYRLIFSPGGRWEGGNVPIYRPTGFQLANMVGINKWDFSITQFVFIRFSRNEQLLTWGRQSYYAVSVMLSSRQCCGSKMIFFSNSNPDLIYTSVLDFYPECR
jgi:hypothetical protein